MITRRAVLRLGGLSGVALLSGCGFQPLYGKQTSGGAIAPELGAIEINEIGEGTERRIGQILKNELIDRFTAGQGRQPTRYRLLVEINQSTAALQIQTNDTVTRFNLVLTADFVLYDSTTSTLLYSSTARATGSYDVVESEYATLVAEEATAEDAARELSNTVTNLLSLYFARER
ncbi:MAG: LPS assembly lipoprotein LptE [Alphaproteobacteria bacterium]|jgi:LPS-assembly lipoprotein